MSKPSKFAMTITGILVALAAAIAIYLIVNNKSSSVDADPAASQLASLGSNSPSQVPTDDAPGPKDPGIIDPSETPSPVPSAAELNIAAVDAATSPQAAADSLMSQIATVLPQEGIIGEDLQLIATDALADQLEALAHEYSDHGWKATGSVKVLSVTVTERKAEEFQIFACLDSSEISVTDQGGNSVVEEDLPPTMNEFTMKQQDGRWVLTDQTFPEELNCS